MLFLYATFFISNTRLKLAKNQAKAKQHPEAKLLHLKIIVSLFMLSSKINIRYSKKCAKIKCVCFNEIINEIEVEMKNGSHRCNLDKIG